MYYRHLVKLILDQFSLIPLKTQETIFINTCDNIDN